MRKVYYPDGREAGQTMTVKELREVLDQYPNDMPVFAVWESCHGYVDHANFSVGPSEKVGCQPCLLIDVEKY